MPRRSLSWATATASWTSALACRRCAANSGSLSLRSRTYCRSCFIEPRQTQWRNGTSPFGCRTTDLDIHLEAGTRQHGNERVHAEQPDLASHEIADPGLRHTEQLCSFLLREFLSLDVLPYFNHQQRTDREIGSLFWWKPQILEYIPR